jgi:hypothetical protein
MREGLRSMCLSGLIASLPLFSFGAFAEELSSGSYIILKDADGRALAGAYSLGPGVRLVKRRQSDDIVLVDREFLPRRVLSLHLMFSRRFGYPDGTEDVALNGPAKFTRKGYQLDFFSAPGAAPGEKPMDEQEVSVLPIGRADMDFADGAAVRIDYDTAPLVGRQMGQSEQRSYIPALAIDLDRDLASRVTAVDTGTATSSMDFDALFSGLAAVDPDAPVCVRQRRAEPAFVEASARFRELVDVPTTSSFPPAGLGYLLDTGIKGEIGKLLSAMSVRACLKPSP